MKLAVEMKAALSKEEMEGNRWGSGDKAGGAVAVAMIVAVVAVVVVVVMLAAQEPPGRWSTRVDLLPGGNAGGTAPMPTYGYR
ncbi:MAG: hypothetical protein CM15mV72_320 [uncultured marine virus]|nr:MAG: hypothetical protein CM15mV72_320 [uncultured marine virus]